MQTIELDARDRAILTSLQQDGRLSNVELAEMVNLSPSACLRRIRMLEQSGLIEGYAMLLDQKACGLPGNAFISITLNQQVRAALDEFEAAIADIPEILECYLIAGGSDYILRVVYSDAADFERIHMEILTQLPGVTRIQSTLALRKVKKTTALPI
jgi:DNA-binding Lrp family transcriptional regulator